MQELTEVGIDNTEEWSGSAWIRESTTHSSTRSTADSRTLTIHYTSTLTVLVYGVAFICAVGCGIVQ